MLHRIVMNIGGKLRRAKLEGRDHLVVPCVMLKEEVIAGSEGAYFYPEAEIAKNPDDWNGMPIVIDHPEVDGEFISARNAEVYNARKVGTILNTQHDGKLRTECWFDAERTRQVDRRVYNAIVKRKKMEVSTGLGMDVDDKVGEFNGKAYKGTARNFKPDHLAVLPDKIGACSVAMGAGLFANMAKQPEGFQVVMMRSIEKAATHLGVKIAANEISFGDAARVLSDLLSEKYGKPGKYWRGYVIDIYDGYVVFENDGETYRQEYTKTKDKIALSGDPVVVRRVVTYTANATPAPTQEPTMPSKFDKKKFVDRLIANGDAAETDREKLMAADETVLAIMETTIGEEVTPEVKAKTEPETVPVATNAKKMTEEEWLAAAPKRLVKIMNRHEAQENAARDQHITKLLATNGKKKFKKEWLEKQDTDTLEALASMVVTANARDEDEDDESPFEADYTAAAGTVTANSKDDDEDDPDQMTPLSAPAFKDPRKNK